MRKEFEGETCKLTSKMMQKISGLEGLLWEEECLTDLRGVWERFGIPGRERRSRQKRGEGKFRKGYAGFRHTKGYHPSIPAGRMEKAEGKPLAQLWVDSFISTWR
jgi:hypothetical protein